MRILWWKEGIFEKSGLPLTSFNPGFSFCDLSCHYRAASLTKSVSVYHVNLEWFLFKKLWSKKIVIKIWNINSILNYLKKVATRLHTVKIPLFLWCRVFSENAFVGLQNNIFLQNMLSNGAWIEVLENRGIE